MRLYGQNLKNSFVTLVPSLCPVRAGVVKYVHSRARPLFTYLLIHLFTLNQIIPAVSLKPQPFQIPRVRDCSVTPQSGVNDIFMANHALARSLSAKPDPEGHALRKIVESVKFVEMVESVVRFGICYPEENIYCFLTTSFTRFYKY